MTQVWEETWVVARGDGDEVVPAEDADLPHGAQRHVACATRPENARLIACAPEMATLLLKLEWAARECTCPICGCSRGDDPAIEYGHEDWCALEVVLRKAGVR
jgi:hypothetical protein